VNSTLSWVLYAYLVETYVSLKYLLGVTCELFKLTRITTAVSCFSCCNCTNDLLILTPHVSLVVGAARLPTVHTTLQVPPREFPSTIWWSANVNVNHAKSVQQFWRRECKLFYYQFHCLVLLECFKQNQSFG